MNCFICGIHLVKESEVAYRTHDHEVLCYACMRKLNKHGYFYNVDKKPQLMELPKEVRRCPFCQALTHYIEVEAIDGRVYTCQLCEKSDHVLNYTGGAR